MKVTVLMENTAISEEFEHKHGLSFYIEGNGKKILSDFGDNDFFINNAEKLGIDLSQVDFAVISHGHGDHGGALSRFLNINDTAKIYAREDVFMEYTSKNLSEHKPVGLNPELENHPQVELVPEHYEIDENFILFSKVDTKLFFPKSNDSLYKKVEDGYEKDDFSHEQYLIIREEGKNFLISGCAHKGILNIVKAAENLIGEKIDACISGFHLYNPSTMVYEDDKFILELGKELKECGTEFYTCHCTGDKAFEILKDVLKDQIHYVSTGMAFNL